jgi:Mn-dependent DtxR family transcriptional regulator
MSFFIDDENALLVLVELKLADKLVSNPVTVADTITKLREFGLISLTYNMSLTEKGDSIITKLLNFTKYNTL